jgi:DNA helicase-2/ATP-dependent DNA helicase PcrA
MEGLNQQQKEAVLHTTGPLLILAGAGAGKTKTIVERILHLIKNGVAPSEILAITFTNKAAKEMRERVEKRLGEDLALNRPVSNHERPFLSTFHALGVHIIKENSRLLNLTRHFTIFDRTDSIGAVKEALKTLGYDPKEMEPGRILGVISKEKGRAVTLADYQEYEHKEYFNRILLSVWEKYEERLKAENALDFDDLLLKSLRLLQTHPEVRAHYQKIWKYIHIDEYQDTNKVQYDMAKILAGEAQNICVVGDIDQSIYSWRGADFKNIMRFEKDYRNSRTILLEQNYRSTKNILDAANSIITKNTLRKEKNLFTENQAGEKIAVYGSFNEEDEARYVAEEAASLMQKGVAGEQIAVLYRANFQSRVLEEAFLNRGIQYQVLGTRFFERKEVKDVLSYIRAALSPESLSDVKRIINTPPRGLGKTTILKVFSGERDLLPEAAKRKVADFYELLERIKKQALSVTPSETVGFVIEHSGMKKVFEEGNEEDRERLANAYELVNLSLKYDFLPIGEGVEKLLEDAALATDQDSLTQNKTGVKLMTVHASKGLEFEYVFITGLEEGLFPYEKEGEGSNKLEAEEEERRLFYVALTRARKKVHLSYAATRSIFGRSSVNIPSRFVFDIDEGLLEGEAPPPRGKVIYLDD